MIIERSKKINSDIDYYIRKKKYKKILDDISSILPDLEAGNLVGDKLEGFNLPEGAALYKVRLIYYVAIEDKIYLLTIYSKKDDERIPNDAQIAMLVGNTLEF